MASLALRVKVEALERGARHAGGTWRAFNASHRRYRENIVQLFGTHSQPAAFQELVLASLSRVIPTIIAIQVTAARAVTSITPAIIAIQCIAVFDVTSIIPTVVAIH